MSDHEGDRGASPNGPEGGTGREAGAGSGLDADRSSEEHSEQAGGEAGEAQGVPPTEGSDSLQMEVANLNDRHLRLAAEFENYRRRAQAQIGESGVRAQAQLVGALLDALDDLRRVLDVDSGSSSVESVIEGVTLVERKLMQTLEEAGLEEIRPEGEPFDPNVMEAFARMPADSEEDDDTVDSVLQRGFRFQGHLVRPARVSVRKFE